MKMMKPRDFNLYKRCIHNSSTVGDLLSLRQKVKHIREGRFVCKYFNSNPEKNLIKLTRQLFKDYKVL
jgi:23S rRNA U2552 (ribose-2'-O)-methylase RlmE/FtsJ